MFNTTKNKDTRKMNDTEKLKDIKERLTKRKLDIIQTLAEDNSIYVPDVLIRLIWELRAIVKQLRWLDE